jgi:O-antigen ligase
MAEMLLLLAAVPVAVAVLVACMREPLRVALPIFAALIPFGGLLSIGSSKFGSLSSLAGLVLGVGLLLQLITTRRSAPRIPADVPVWLLFLATAAATALWTIDRPATIEGILVLGSLVLVYALSAVSHVDRTVLSRTENALLLGGVVVVCYGLAQLFLLGGFPDDVAGAGPSADGRFGNDMLGPGVQAVALVVPLVIALSRAFSGRPMWSRLLHVVIAGLMVCGVLMTGARGGTLAAGVAMVALALAGPRRSRNALLTVAAVGSLVAALVWIYHPAGIATRSFESATSSSGRTDIWEVGLAACTEYCAFGSGWGSFPDVYAETQASVPEARVLVGDEGSYQPHNLWLLAAVELGVAGLILLTLGLALSFIEALRLPRSLRGPPLSALVGTLVAVFFLSSMEFKFFWMVLILVTLNRNLYLAEQALTVSDRDEPGRPRVRDTMD